MEPPKRHSPLMEDIAKRAGVARSTVSMALRNHSSLPKKTCERIQRIAREMGYRPNPLVTALMTNLRSTKGYHQKPTLGFVSAFPIEEWSRNVPTFRRMLTGVTERTEQLGYALETFWLGEPGMTPKRLSRILTARGIPGFILSPLEAPTQNLEMDWESLTCVAIGHTLAAPVLHKVSNHQYHAVMVALEKLQSMGYRKIGLAMEANMDEKVDHNWVAGFLVKEFTDTSTRFPIFLASDWNEARFRQWFQKHRPEAVISFSLEVQAWLANLGLKIPRDVGFATLDWSPEMKGLAGIDQKSELVGAAAVDLLVEQIHHNHRGIPETPKVVFIEGKWVEGKTARKRKTKPKKAATRTTG